MNERACIRGCGRSPAKGKRKCGWCTLAEKPIADQLAAARWRRQEAEARPGYEYRARVSPKEWPDGWRWCAGCQFLVPLDYCTGSRCKAHASEASHEGRVASTYGMPPGQYEALLAFQGGRCYICGKVPRSSRLAVDHDHTCCPGEVSCGRCVRGLLCANNERGCNHVVVGNLEGARDGFRAAAWRLWCYANDPPYKVLLRQQQARQAVDPGGLGLEEPPF
jgi:hypothetical protein